MTRRPLCLVCLLLMCAMCLADVFGIPLIRGNPLPDDLQEWIREHPESVICGEVDRYTKSEFSQSVYLKNSYLICDSQKISIENVRVFLEKETGELPAGTYLYLEGSLERVPECRNPGEFDSRQYYACQHIYYFLKDGVIRKRSRSYSGTRQFLVELRGRFLTAIEEAAGEAAPVLQAMVLGEKSELDTETRLRYQLGGIIHILAISGLHISILGTGLYHLLQKLGLGIWPSALAALAIILPYGVMTGTSVSAMRAVCMFLLSAGAKILGRIYDMPTALSVSAVLILLESPAYLYNGSFLLSFGSVAAMGAVAAPVTEILRVKGKTGKSLAASLAVQLTTLPVSLYFFGEASLAGLILNLAVLPTAGAVLASGVGTALLGCVLPEAAMAAALPGRLLLAGYRQLCDLASRLPFCVWVGGRPEIWQIAVYYVLLCLAVILASGKPRARLSSGGCLSGREERKLRARLFSGRCLSGQEERKFRSRLFSVRRLHTSEGRNASRRGLGLCLLAAGFVVLGFQERSLFRITCLDVGQGDGIVAEAPEGYCFLIDGGSAGKRSLGQYQLLPYLKSRGISHVDGIFVSHTDQDHISGLVELLELREKRLTAVSVGCLYLPKWEEPPEAWKNLAALAERAGAKVCLVERGDTIRAGRTKIRFLAPEPGTAGKDTNGESAVLQMEYEGFRALFTGDIGTETEKRLLEEFEDVDFLKVAHHGSAYSTCEAFLEQVQPEIAVISCSAENVYGHPSPETLKRLEQIGCQVECTMDSGAVTIYTDGEGTGVSRFLEADSS